MASYSDIVKILPYRIRSRCDSLGAFVKAVLDEEDHNREQVDKLTTDDIQLIQLLVLVGFLDSFFEDGTTAARSAVRRFEDLGVRGFTVGRKAFEGDNENVRLGEELAKELRDTLSRLGGERLVRLARSPEQGVRRHVLNLRRQLTNG